VVAREETADNGRTGLLERGEEKEGEVGG